MWDESLLITDLFNGSKAIATVIAKLLKTRVKSIVLRQKKNYGNSNISPCKNTIFQKIL
jgi:hypothetical protein